MTTLIFFSQIPQLAKYLFYSNDYLAYFVRRNIRLEVLILSLLLSHIRNVWTWILHPCTSGLKEVGDTTKQVF